MANMSPLAAFLSFLIHTFAYPSGLHEQRAPTFEWTAWGDSYASGVGAGNYLNGRRCLRFDAAYAAQSQLSAAGIKLNNAVCSAAKVEDVELYQLYTQDMGGEPDILYYPRPSSGRPNLGSLTVGGDDVDFFGVLNSCITEGFPFPITIATTPRTCAEQRDFSWSLISQDSDRQTPNATLVANLDRLITKLVAFGRNATGDSFRLYVTSYGRFFSPTMDPACNNITFTRKANPTSDGKKHNLMTVELRQDLNAMASVLNLAISKAVEPHKDNVRYVDIDSLLDGHRFCEPGILEPDLQNERLWFFHYPYDDVKSSQKFVASHLNTIDTNSVHFDPERTLWVDYVNELWSKVDPESLENDVLQRFEDDFDRPDIQLYDIWSDYFGVFAKTFHPTSDYHKKIYETIIDQYKNDTGYSGA